MAQKVYVARNGAKYIKLANGMARFISGPTKPTKRGPGKRKAKRRSTARSPQVIYTKKRSVPSMARRKVSRRSVKRRARGIASGYSREIGTAIYAFAEPMADNLVGGILPGIPTDLLKTGAGFMFRKKKGIVGGVANAAMTIGIYKLVRGFLGGGVSNNGGGFYS